MNKSIKNETNILSIKQSDQFRTVEELIIKSQPGSVYYTFLILAAIIIAAGLLMENVFIVIGGMLVAPVLTPILAIALGLSIGDIKPIKNVYMLLLKSIVIVILTSIIMAFVLGLPKVTPIFENTMRTAILYFIVALASGIAATFAWVRKENSEAITGIAIAITLVPPLSLIGIAISIFNAPLMHFNFLVFAFNFLGITLGSLVAFSLLKFHKSEKKLQETEKKIESQKKDKPRNK